MKEESRRFQETCLDPMESEGERTEAATRICYKACDETGVKVSSWQEFDAWKQYVEGEIEDAELTEQARREMGEFSASFGKYLVIEKEDLKYSEEEEEKRKRARRANSIYRQVCREAGLSLFFFHDFLSWSDYVEGKISDAVFYERARREVMQIQANLR